MKSSRIGKKLVEWGIHNYRDFPWRYTYNPYFTAISELLLRRTRAEQVVKVYSTLVSMYPDMCSLYHAREYDITSVVSKLGIYRRIPLILNCASFICHRLAGKIPKDRTLLEQVPGFGDYTVSAIEVFAYRKNVPLVDANTLRITARISGIIITDSLRKTHRIHDIYSSLVGNENPVKFGYAILDLGAIVCTQNPKCQICPVSEFCTYNRSLEITGKRIEGT